MQEETKSFNTKPSLPPQKRRELSLERRVNFLIVFVIVQFLGVTAFGVAFITIPRVPIVIDHATGEVVGDYRASSFRTQEEMINGGMRFVDHHMSVNSSTVRRDQFIALSMMSEELREKRIQYLEDSNLIAKLEAANSSGHVVYDETNIVYAKANKMRIEYIGKIVLTGLKKPHVPFHIIVDLTDAPVTERNTSGVLVENFNDF